MWDTALLWTGHRAAGATPSTAEQCPTIKSDQKELDALSPLCYHSAHDPTPYAAAEAHLAAADPVLAALIATHGPCTLDPRPALLSAPWSDSIISQQISVKAAATILRRFVALLPDGGSRRRPILALTTRQMRGAGLSGAKARYMRDLAEKVAAGAVDLARIEHEPDEAVINELVQVKGIGRWTAEMFLIFSLGRLDVLPVDDLGFRTGRQRAYGLPALPGKADLGPAPPPGAPTPASPPGISGAAWRTRPSRRPPVDEDLARFGYEVGQLKLVKRTGWWVAGVRDPESVAEHSYRVAVIAYRAGDAGRADPGPRRPGRPVPRPARDAHHRSASRGRPLPRGAGQSRRRSCGPGRSAGPPARRLAAALAALAARARQDPHPLTACSKTPIAWKCSSRRSNTGRTAIAACRNGSTARWRRCKPNWRDTSRRRRWRKSRVGGSLVSKEPKAGPI